MFGFWSVLYPYSICTCVTLVSISFLILMISNRLILCCFCFCFWCPRTLQRNPCFFDLLLRYFVVSVLLLVGGTHHHRTEAFDYMPCTYLLHFVVVPSRGTTLKYSQYPLFAQFRPSLLSSPFFPSFASICYWSVSQWKHFVVFIPLVSSLVQGTTLIHTTPHKTHACPCHPTEPEQSGKQTKKQTEKRRN